MIASTYHLGIDVGSTTAKAVVFDPLAQRVLFSRYVRHNAHQVETVATLLRTVAKEFPECSFRLVACGSGGTTIADALGVPFVQEVVANSLAVRRDHENVRCAIELGGQDAKMVFFERDEKSGATTVADMRMNGSCAGGTGAFIDEMAALLKVPVEQFDALAARGQSVHQVSGRCGVYAKTDIQPLLNQGVSKEDLALSSFHAIAKQTIGGLAQGLDIHPPVIFEGGPLTFNPTLVRVFAERLELADDDIVIPQNPETIVALGAALAADELFTDCENCLIADLLDAADILDKAAASPAPSTRGTTYFASDEERAAWEASHALAPQTPPDPAPARRCAPTWASIRAPPLPSLHSFPPMGSLSIRFTPPTRASRSTSHARRSSHCATAIAQRVPRSTSWAWEPLATASSCSRKPSAPTTTRSRP